MIGVETDFFKIVVLAAHTEALLRIGYAARFRHSVSQNYILELVHARIGEHKCRIIFNHHRSRGYYAVPFRLEIVFERLAYFFGGKHIIYKCRFA